MRIDSMYFAIISIPLWLVCMFSFTFYVNIIVLNADIIFNVMLAFCNAEFIALASKKHHKDKKIVKFKMLLL